MPDRNSTAAAVPRDGLAAEYLFEGSAFDSAPKPGGVRGSDGNPIGTTFVEDRFGRSGHACSFAGTGQYVIILDPPELSAEGFTLSVWLRVAEPDETGHAIICQDSGESFHHSYASHGRVFQLLCREGVPVWHRMHWQGEGDLKAANRLTPGAWHHIVCVVEGDTHRMYVDSRLESEGKSWFSVSRDQPIYIGRLAPHMVGNPFGKVYHNLGEPLFLNGSVDDVRLYNRALDQTEIDALFHENGWKT